MRFIIVGRIVTAIVNKKYIQDKIEKRKDRQPWQEELHDLPKLVADMGDGYEIFHGWASGFQRDIYFLVKKDKLRELDTNSKTDAQAIRTLKKEMIVVDSGSGWKARVIKTVSLVDLDKKAEQMFGHNIVWLGSRKGEKVFDKVFGKPRNSKKEFTIFRISSDPKNLMGRNGADAGGLIGYLIMADDKGLGIGGDRITRYQITFDGQFGEYEALNRSTSRGLSGKMIGRRKSGSSYWYSFE